MSTSRLNIDHIQTREPFNRLFPIEQRVLSSVVMHMRREGFDEAHPVSVWKEPDGQHTVVDGHTRHQAAGLAGIAEIPVVIRDFRTEDEALDYAVRCQRDRRNLTDADIVRLVKELDKRRQRGGDRKSEKSIASHEAFDPPGKSADATAKLIGTSRAKVEKARAVSKKAAPQVQRAVETGNMGLNRAYQATRSTKPKQPAGGKPTKTANQEHVQKKARPHDAYHKVIDLLRSMPDHPGKIKKLNSIMHCCANLAGDQVTDLQFVWLDKRDRAPFWKWRKEGDS